MIIYGRSGEADAAGDCCKRCCKADASNNEAKTLSSYGPGMIAPPADTPDKGLPWYWPTVRRIWLACVPGLKQLPGTRCGIGGSSPAGASGLVYEVGAFAGQCDTLGMAAV